MGDAREQSSRQWAGRPRVAKLLRFVVWLLPILVSVVVTHFISKGFPRPAGLLSAIAWFIGLCVVATAILLVVDKAARRLLPLAALLQLSLVFPDSAPSRFKAALRTQTVRQLEQRVAEIKESGLSDDPAIAAETLIELIAALSAHDRLTRGHAERVRAYSRMIGEELNLSEKDLDLLQWAGLAHDVGKLFVPGEILNKTSRLTDEEFDIIKKHPGWGAELCAPLRPWLGDWVNAVGEHHERWDGNGYPNGLAGTDISLAARIVSVADVYDVITSIRSYKAAGTSAEAREELAKCAGTQFDERIVRAFLNISLGRLRVAMGPLSWMAQIPIVAQMPLVPVAGAVASVVVTGGAMIAGGTFAQADEDPPEVPAAVAELLPDTTLPEPLPPATVPLVVVAAPASVATTPSTTPPTTARAVSVPPLARTAVPTTTTVSEATTTTAPRAPAATTPTTTTPTTTTLPPFVAINRAVAAEEDTTIDIDVGNGGGSNVVASVLVASAHGTVIHRGGTVFAFSGNDNFNGETSFEYQIRDAAGRTSSGTATISVLPLPDAPRAANDVAAVDENDTVEIPVLANDVDPDGDRLVIAAVSSGDGTVSTDGATILYSPATDTNGTHQVDYFVEDGTGRSDRATVTVAVSPVNSRPTLSDPGPQSIDEGAPLSFVADASDPDVPVDDLTFALVNGATPVPPGAAIDPVTGMFTWTPSESQGGTSYSFNVRVTDTGVPSLFDEIEVEFDVADVNEVPALAPIGNRVVGEQAPLNFTVSASDSDLPADNLTFFATGLPVGATLDPSTGDFSWTPSESQGDMDFPVTFGATDDGVGALSDTESVVLSVSDVNAAPILSDPGAQSVDEGAILSFVVPASDADVPADGLSFSLANGLTPVPAGATIDPVTGAFSWTPSESQGATSYSFRIRVIDDGSPNLSDEVEISFVVNEVNQAPVLADPGDQAVGEQAALNLTLSATDADLPAENLTFSASGLPAGASLDPASGAFSWTPSEVQGGLSVPILFSVADDGAGLLTDTVSIRIDVTEINDAPVLDPIGDRTADEGSAMAFTLSASDTDLPVEGLTFSASGLPAGASLNAATGAFSWTPSEAQGGTDFPVTFTVTDDGAGAISDSESVVLSAAEVNVAPVLADPGAQSVDEGAVLSFAASATDADVPVDGLVFTLVDGLTPVPAGATIDSASGVFSWTPSESQGGTSYSFKLRVTDDGAPNLFDEVEVGFVVNEINEAPVLDPIGDRGAGEGATMVFTLSASDTDLPVEGLTFSASGLPPGASLNAATGAFSWTPSEAQGGTDFAVTFAVADDGIGVLSDQEAVTLSATEVNEAPMLTDPGAQSGDEGAVLSFSASATDVDDPADGLAFTLVDGVTPVPAGAAIDAATGAFSWTPSESQGGTSYSFKLRVTDDGSPNLFGEVEVSFGINDLNQAPVLDPIGNQAIEEGAPLSLTLSATDADLPADGLTFTATGLPAGASLNGATGALSWTPTEAQGGSSFGVTFMVTDDGVGALSANETVQLTATEVNEAPSITDPGDQSAAVGEVVSLNLTAADADVPANNLEFAASGLPAGLTLDSGTGVISGSPTTLELTTVTITVTETDGAPSNLSDSAAFDWTITPANIVISEIATSGPGGNTDEFIELYNPTSSTISIGGWELRRSDGNMTQRSTLVMTGGASIGPNEYFLISHDSVRMALGADDWYSSGELRVGSGIALFTDLGVEVDAVGTGPVPWKDGAGSLYGEGTHLPPMSGSVTQSYERKSGVGNCIDTDDNAADFFHNMGSRNPQNSGSAAATCGTPTPPTPPPVPDHLVISEFRFDGSGGGDDEFVEIFNPTAFSIPLLGYELRNQIGGGGLEAVITGADLTRLGTLFIEPGEHLVFGSNTYDDGPSAYDKVDIRTSGGITNGSGVYLVAPAIPFVSPATVVDAVSTGGTVELEGDPLPAITGRVIHSYERLLGGSGGNCFDTDNNIADFFHNLSSENPQLLSAPATTCPP